MGIRKILILLTLGILLFSNSPIVAQAIQGELVSQEELVSQSAEKAPVLIESVPTEETQVQVFVPDLPTTEVAPVKEKPSATQIAPLPTKVKVVTEVEIRPVDGVMKVKTKGDPVPIETTLEKPVVKEELVKVVPGPALPTSKAIAIKQTPDGVLEIEVGEVSASTTLPIKVVENNIEVEVKDKWETVILPSRVEILVKDVSPSPTEVKKMELVECKPTLGPEQDCQAIYKTEIERKTRFLGIIEVRPTLKYEVNAASGHILREEKPWYLRILPFLFR